MKAIDSGLSGDRASENVQPEVNLAELGLELIKSVTANEKAKVGLLFPNETVNYSRGGVIKDMVKPLPFPMHGLHFRLTRSWNLIAT